MRTCGQSSCIKPKQLQHIMLVQKESCFLYIYFLFSTTSRLALKRSAACKVKQSVSEQLQGPHGHLPRHPALSQTTARSRCAGLRACCSPGILRGSRAWQLQYQRPAALRQDLGLPLLSTAAGGRRPLLPA